MMVGAPESERLDDEIRTSVEVAARVGQFLIPRRWQPQAGPRILK